MIEESIKFKKTRRNTIFLFLFLGICIIILLFGIFKTDYFHIDNIIVQDNVFVTKQEIISLSQLTGKNIFLINKNKTEEYIKLNPYIKGITINRKLPRTVIINVNEKKIRGIIKFKNGFINIDNEGKMVQIVDKFPKGKLPMILETNVDKYIPNELVYKPGSNELQALVAALTVSDYNETKYFFYSIDVKDPFNILLCTNSGRLVRIGDWENMDYKIAYAISILKSPDIKGLHGYIQLQDDGSAIFKKN